MKNILLLISLLPFTVAAQLQLAKIFSDNMVVQRDQPVHIWGKAVPQQKISIEFAAQTKYITANADSTWSIYFKKQSANKIPQSLLVRSATEKIEIRNILMGDVWLCIGQSNMEFPMMKEMHYKDEIQNSNLPLLRFYNPAWAGKNIFNTPYTDSIVQRLNREKFYQGNWQVSDHNSIKQMSAVGYYFGKEILLKEDIPVGIINISIGGAPLETFISTNDLLQSNQFAAKVKDDWLLNDALPVWIRERGNQNVGSLKNVSSDATGKYHAYKPGVAYDAGVKPLIPFAIKGILNYQGESNAQEMDRVDEYAALSKRMIDDYRRQWKRPTLPFYFVQLSSIDTAKYKGQLWPQFRDEQRRMMALIPNSGMAVSSDIGARDDVHPTNKKVVGERLARWALNKTYKRAVIPSGPLPVAAKYKKGKVIIAFQYAGTGLKTSDGNKIKGFSTNGLNELDALVDKKKVVIFLKEKPTFIYYGWKPFTNANLVNSELLPASTFKIVVK